MSKTLFNTNTFQNKNVTNSNNIETSVNVGDIIADSATITNATITNLTNSELQGKQDTLSEGDGIDLTNNVVSLDGTRTGNFAITGNLSQEGTDFKIWNTTAGGIDGEGNPQSNGRVFVHTGSGTKASSILRLNYNDDFGGGVQIDSIVGISTPPNSSYDLKVNGNTNIGGVLSLPEISNVKTTIQGKQDTLSTGDGIDITNNVISFDGTLSQDITTSGFIRGGSLEYLDGGVVTDVQTEIESKQDTLTAGDGIRINASNEVLLDGTRTGNFLITGNFESDGTEFKLWNDTRGGAGQSNGRVFVHTGSGTKASSILRLNYLDDFGGGTQIDSIVSIGTTPNSSYDLNVNGNTNIGGVLSIDGYSNVKTALDNATSGGTYTAQANGGLAVSNNEFYIDLTNTNADFEIPQNVIVENDTTDAQLTIQPASNTSQDAIVKIIGARNGTESVRQAQIRLQNYDHDITATNNLVEIAGVVTNRDSNIGGLQIANFTNGSTRAVAMTMNHNGRFHMGNSFQDTYKLQVTGNTNFTGDSIIGGTLQIAGISNVRTAIEGKQDPISAASGGGLAVVNNEISVDFSNTSASVEIPQRVIIEDDTTAQLIVRTVSSGNDAAITIRGERNTTSNRQAQLRLENTLSGTTNDLAEIAGVVTNAGSNIGGLGIYNFADGSTRTTAMTMNNNGRFHFGTTFQNDYKLQVTGNTNFTGDTNVGGDLSVTGNPNKRIAIVNLRKNEASNGLWGLGNYFDFGQNMQRIGASFCSESFGVVTLNTSGTFKISVSVQIENQSFNNRVVVGTYVSINDNTTNWRNQSNSGRFGLTYIRHDDYGFGGSQSYSDYYELDSGQNIRIKTMLGEGSAQRVYDETENDDNIHLYGRLEIELISTADLVESGV